MTREEETDPTRKPVPRARRRGHQPRRPALLGEKLYFKIGEVARIVGVKPYVLRYWETEFSILKPGKTRSKHRLYRRRDVTCCSRSRTCSTSGVSPSRARARSSARNRPRRGSASGHGALAEIREALVRIRDSLN